MKIFRQSVYKTLPLYLAAKPALGPVEPLRPRRPATLRKAAAVGFSLFCLGASATANAWVSGFYVGWMANSYPPSAIDFSSLSHAMMFSVLPNNDGTLNTGFFGAGSGVAVEVAQRAHAAGKKAVLVVGGAGYGAQMRSAASAANIDRFVQNLAGAASQYGYDGIDIDWEPIQSTDYSLMLSLVSKLRAALPAGSLITADVGWLSLNFPLSAADAQFYAQLSGGLDQMNIMTYSMADNWGGWTSWHSSAVYDAASNRPSSVEVSVNGYLNAGVPAAKLGLGIGFYGSCWNSPVTAPRQSPGSSHVVASDNEFGYANIMTQYYSAAAYRYDTPAQAPYLSFAAPTGPYGCTFLSYEDETSVAAKGQFARSKGLGGAIVWQINEGYIPGAANPNALLAAVGQAFLDDAPATPPAAPTGLAAGTAAGPQVNLSWVDNADNESGFRVERASGGASFSLIATLVSNTTGYADTIVSEGITYTYRVRASNSAGYSDYSNNAAATPPVTIPVAPASLSASAASRTQINLAWNDRSNNEQGFYIERSPDGSNWTRIASVGANVKSYNNTGLIRNTAYYYRVQAYTSAGGSAYSNTVSARTKR